MYWQWRIKTPTGETTVTYGSDPKVGLAEARKQHREAQEQRRTGVVNPNVLKRQAKLAAVHDATNTFEAVARDWFEVRRHDWVATYRFAIAGTSYEGSRIGYAVLLSERDAHRFVSAHPAGTPVTVYADPASPTRSTLRRGGATAAFALTRVGVALAVFAAYARRKSRQAA